MKRKSSSTGTVLAILAALTLGPMAIDQDAVLEVHRPGAKWGLMPKDRKDPDEFRFIKTRLITGGLLPEAATSHSTAVLAQYGE